ncbi:hypothetical protein [Nocardia wallacei]|uniref:WXG100-like domain-containing protein n=1 Tax=Nocardia wallacei TaxID=480035 RepID=UPI002458FB31|nr:hypothetical protein [Nocardia wallacei]
MTLEIPKEIPPWVIAAVAGPWPEGDEDALRRLGAAWKEIGDAITRVSQLAGEARNRALAAIEGLTGEALEKHGLDLDGDLKHVAAACYGLSEQCMQDALATEYSKYVIIGSLVALVIQLGVDAFVPGVGQVHGAAATAATRLTVRAAFRELITRLGTEGARAAAARMVRAIAFKGVTLGAVQGGAIPLAAQAVQMTGPGHYRKEFDWKDIGLGVVSGAAAGAAGEFVGVRAMTGLERRFAGNATSAARNRLQQTGIRFAGAAAGGAAGAVAGVASVVPFTGQLDMGWDHLLPGMVGGVLGSMPHALRGPAGPAVGAPVRDGSGPPAGDGPGAGDRTGGSPNGDDGPPPSAPSGDEGRGSEGGRDDGASGGRHDDSADPATRSSDEESPSGAARSEGEPPPEAVVRPENEADPASEARPETAARPESEPRPDARADDGPRPQPNEDAEGSGGRRTEAEPGTSREENDTATPVPGGRDEDVPTRSSDEAQPETSARPEDESGPGSEVRPDSAARPENEPAPATEARPENMARPENEGESVGEARPEAVARPEDEGESVGEARPEAVARPENEAVPEGEARPETVARPETEVRPEDGARSRPREEGEEPGGRRTDEESRTPRDESGTETPVPVRGDETTPPRGRDGERTPPHARDREATARGRDGERTPPRGRDSETAPPRGDEGEVTAPRGREAEAAAARRGLDETTRDADEATAPREVDDTAVPRETDEAARRRVEEEAARHEEEAARRRAEEEEAARREEEEAARREEEEDPPTVPTRRTRLGDEEAARMAAGEEPGALRVEGDWSDREFVPDLAGRGTDTYSKDQVIEMWENKIGRRMTPSEIATLELGCVGITSTVAGHPLHPPNNLVFSDPATYRPQFDAERVLVPLDRANSDLNNAKMSLLDAQDRLREINMAHSYDASVPEVIEARRVVREWTKYVDQLRQVAREELMKIGDEVNRLQEQRAMAQLEHSMATKDMVLGYKRAFEDILERQPATREEFLQMVAEDPQLSGLRDVGRFLPSGKPSEWDIVVFAKHFYSGQEHVRDPAGNPLYEPRTGWPIARPTDPNPDMFAPDPETGQVDMSGDLCCAKGPGMGNFDFGLYLEDIDAWMNANHMEYRDPAQRQADPMKAFVQTDIRFHNYGGYYDSAVMGLVFRRIVP